jgi:hypothetical protein
MVTNKNKKAMSLKLTKLPFERRIAPSGGGVVGFNNMNIPQNTVPH